MSSYSTVLKLTQIEIVKIKFEKDNLIPWILRSIVH